MSDFQVQVQRLIDELVARIGALAHATATELVEAATDAARAAVERRRAQAPAAPPTPATPPAAPGRGGKRPADAIEQTKLRVLQFVRVHPGLRVEQINRELGTSTRELALPLRKLIAEGKLRSEGEKRSTQYYPAGEPPRAPAPAAPLAPVRRRKG